MARRAGLLATLLLMLTSGCGRPPLEAALAELATAERCDRALEGAADPASLEQQRDGAYRAAETQLQAVLARQPAPPAARLAAATLAWHYHQDLSAALRHANAAVSALEQAPAASLEQLQPGGQRGAQLLAAALACRAGLLLSAYTNPSDAGAQPAAVPAGPLDQAAADARRAVALDPQPPYQTLLASIQRFAAAPPGAAPLDPGALQERPASPEE
ncbi:MAG: hypothetical protein IT204_21640 [Fimbriimonadaceae bacterium]|nr:hypothetical protein [Fimbriimonadaceae bacterium]